MSSTLKNQKEKKFSCWGKSLFHMDRTAELICDCVFVLALNTRIVLHQCSLLSCLNSLHLSSNVTSFATENVNGRHRTDTSVKTVRNIILCRKCFWSGCVNKMQHYKWVINMKWKLMAWLKFHDRYFVLFVYEDNVSLALTVQKLFLKCFIFATVS